MQRLQRDLAFREESCERLGDACCDLEYDVEHLRAELLASKAREDVLREVIRENCMSMHTPR